MHIVPIVTVGPKWIALNETKCTLCAGHSMAVLTELELVESREYTVMGYKGIPYSIDSCCHALYSVQLKRFDGVHAQSIKLYSKFEQFNLL